MRSLVSAHRVGVARLCRGGHPFARAAAHSRRRLPAPARGERAAIHRHRCARFQSRPRGKAQASADPDDPLCESLGLGMAARAHRHNGALGRSSARAVSVRAAAVRGCRHPGDLRRPSAGGGGSDGGEPARSARAPEVRDGRTRLRAAARQPDVRAGDAHRALVEDRGGRVRSAAAGEVRRAAGQPRCARIFRARPVPCCSWNRCR